VKAVAVLNKGELAVVDVPLPRIAEYECLVRVRACAFCNGTDLKIIDDTFTEAGLNYPLILGHESVGEVVEVGSEVESVHIGDVFTNPIGRLEPPSPYKALVGEMKEYCVVQDRAAMERLGVDLQLYSGAMTRPVPASMSPEDASILLTLKEAYSALRNFGFAEGMDVLVFGDGPVGLALTRFLRMRHAGWVACVGHHDERLDRIRETGQLHLAINSMRADVSREFGDRRFDLVIDAVGSTAVIEQGSHLLKPGGKVGVYGVLKRHHMTMNLRALRNNTSVHMLNFPYQEHAVHDDILEMVREGTVNPGDYWSHALPADEIERAVQLVRSREAFKVVLTF
jgi:L-iditol 2-dehydrogenase